MASNQQFSSVVSTPICVIASCLNESDQIESWLENLSWVDRFIVVDTGSIDGSPELLREKGVHVIEWSPPHGLIHAAKNRAIAAVESGWILDLDLDERVPSALREEILSELAEVDKSDRNSPPSAYKIPFRHYVFGRWLKAGGWRTEHIRLYRCGRARYPETRAHSTIEVEGALGSLQGEVLHFAQPSIHDFWTKLNRYTSQDASLLVEQSRGGLRNRPRLPVRKIAWVRAAFSVFWNRFIKASGFRDRVPGFIVAVLLAGYIFVEQAKAWEYEELKAGKSS